VVKIWELVIKIFTSYQTRHLHFGSNQVSIGSRFFCTSKQPPSTRTACSILRAGTTFVASTVQLVVVLSRIYTPHTEHDTLAVGLVPTLASPVSRSKCNHNETTSISEQSTKSRHVDCSVFARITVIQLMSFRSHYSLSQIVKHSETLRRPRN